MVRAARLNRFEPEVDPRLPGRIRDASAPLRNARDLDPLMERIGDARFVLLGEASHGTSEYYTWRAEISRRLITEKGFQFIAVEGDWPSCDQLDRSIKGRGDGDIEEALQAFDRWPSWMWANAEIAELAEWLKEHNKGRPDQVGFHGLDVYSLWDSLYAVVGYLRRVDPGAIDAALRAFRCFEPFGEDAQEYARATSRLVPSSCEDEAIALLSDIRRKAPAYREDDRWGAFHAEQNALVVRDAEAYYRAMVRGGPESWNVRDRHMQETLERLARFYGPASRGIVWEHNTHIGDARFTDMAGDGMVNIGQLARERWGEDDALLVGFSTYRGTVIAGNAWDAPAERMSVPEAREGSWDELLHRAGGGDKLVLLDGAGPFGETRGQRAIGVVYHPQYENYGNYVPTDLARRYDALLFLDETRALRPLAVPLDLHEEIPETFPSGR
ncbi:MAG: protein-L-isoaspartate O-methyltransferase [Planctomycetes bacterium SCN 63-9]|nr:MAG: protein-L-isoaspartate O-methyltransferase [Planctomycetes bacterium SCN 63-9]